MADKKKSMEETKSVTPVVDSKSATDVTPAGGQAPQTLTYDESAHATYSNLCRVTGTPEEVIMDFALNPNSFGAVLEEPMKIDHRIVMGYQAAKRTALVMLETVRRYEERFGEIELDPRKRLKGFKVVGG